MPTGTPSTCSFPTSRKASQPVTRTARRPGPPLEANGEPTAGPELDGALLGAVERTDGSTQVTYNDLPLYLFSGDEAAGDTNGQGLNDV